ERMHCVGVDDAYSQDSGVLRLPVPFRYQQGARAADQSSIGEWDRKGTQIGGVCTTQRRVQVRPPLRWPVGVRQCVGQVGRAHAWYPEYGRCRVPRVQGTGQQVRYEFGDDVDDVLGLTTDVEQDRIARG